MDDRNNYVDCSYICPERSFLVQLFLSERKKEEEFRQKKLIELYVDFCTGRITTSQLYERGNMVLDKMPDDPVKNRIYDLMKLHLSILEGKGDLEEKIPEDASKEPLLIAQGYVWYLISNGSSRFMIVA